MKHEHDGSTATRGDTINEPSGGSEIDEVVGPFYTVNSLAEVIGRSTSTVYRRIATGTVLAGRLRDGRTLVCPTWQAEGGAISAELVGVWQILRDAADDWTALLWMCAPHKDLEQESPVRWIRLGRELDAVTHAARQTAAGWAQ